MDTGSALSQVKHTLNLSKHDKPAKVPTLDPSDALVSDLGPTLVDWTLDYPLYRFSAEDMRSDHPILSLSVGGDLITQPSPYQQEANWSPDPFLISRTRFDHPIVSLSAGDDLITRSFPYQQETIWSPDLFLISRRRSDHTIFSLSAGWRVVVGPLSWRFVYVLWRNCLNIEQKCNVIKI